ncbi:MULTISPECIES: metal-dependent hydrolase [Thermocrispum]|uniref:Metal-dependent hydrolase n=1 Tax=Thermocrispum agreste TaxID=37925 RepID=A0A2W4JT10_9PSEU|nr:MULTISPECIES: metal-dependent hydrolase [Thermocrispum]PZN01502.1 MAG: metal-dependent hydrolase [Thermocrispum agreste]
MMGRTHALTGWCAGLAFAPVVGAGDLHKAVAFATVTAGFALLPDLDHPGARASRLLGPVTKALSWLLRRASAGLYAVTKGPRDEKVKGTHRHLSHTVVFAVLLGLLTALGTEAGGPWAVAAVALFAVLLAEDALGDWLLPVATAAVTWWISSTPEGIDELGPLAGWLGYAVALGCIVHCLGDALTKSGCPFLWPIPIRGETWYEIRPPKALRFRTSGPAENWVIVPLFSVLAVALVPGASEWALDVAAQVISR